MSVTAAVAQLSLPEKLQLLVDLQRELLPQSDVPHYVVYNVGDTTRAWNLDSFHRMQRDIADRELSSGVLYMANLEREYFPIRMLQDHRVHTEAMAVHAAMKAANIEVNGVVVKYQEDDAVQALIPVLADLPGLSLLSAYPATITLSHIMMNGVIKTVLVQHFT